MSCNNASSRRQRAEREAVPARHSQNPTPAPSSGPPGGPEVGTEPVDEHPSDPDPWLYAKLDELHVAVQAADSRQRRSRTSDQEACPPDDTATCDVLAALARVWIEWLIEAAGNGDPAARAHLRDLGFHRFDPKADGKGQC